LEEGFARYDDAKMDRIALRTQFSIQASTLAESYRGTVGRLRVGPHDYAPDMTSPDGQSTGGGVQALQHLRLVPGLATMPTLLVGHANQRDHAAELRTWEHVDAICRERYKQPAPIDPAQYQQFLQSAEGFLAACGLRVTFAPTPEDMVLRGVRVDEEPRSPGRALFWGLASLATAIALFAAAAAFWMHAISHK
jgi:hypothetical protein